MEEKHLLKSLDHPFCINLFWTLTTEENIYLILEQAEGKQKVSIFWSMSIDINMKYDSREDGVLELFGVNNCFLPCLINEERVKWINV